MSLISVKTPIHIDFQELSRVSWSCYAVKHSVFSRFCDFGFLFSRVCDFGFFSSRFCDSGFFLLDFAIARAAKFKTHRSKSLNREARKLLIPRNLQELKRSKSPNRKMRKLEIPKYRNWKARNHLIWNRENSKSPNQKKHGLDPSSTICHRQL